jgi:Mrp family chromosome partitioning ATPase
MQNHKPLLAEAETLAHLGPAAMDDDQFRKLAEDARRPPPPGIGLFGPGSGAPRAPAEPVPNLPVVLPRLADPDPLRTWDGLARVGLDPLWLAGNGLFPSASTDPAAAAFDILRTRLLQAVADRGWRRIAVTSPTHGCGKTFVAANLALSLARRPATRNVLLDFELRRPGLATLLGAPAPGAIEDMLTGRQPIESHLVRHGDTLALGLNDRPVVAAAERLQSPDTAAALDALVEALAPEVILIDTPPLLANDDVLAILPRVDAVLLVADGTRSLPDDITASERLLADHKPLLGVVLNRAQDLDLGRTRYRARRAFWPWGG